MIDKKLNSMNSDYNNIQEAVKTMQMEGPFDSYLSSKQFINKSKKNNGRSCRYDTFYAGKPEGHINRKARLTK